MTRILLLVVLVSLLFVAGCGRLYADAPRTTFQPVQISAPDADAAEPVTVSAPDGSFYVAWVNHDTQNKADVMLARFNNEGAANGAAVRVNRQPGVATAWRGDQPSVAVSADAVYVLWTARVDSDGKKGTDLYLSTSNDRGQSFLSEVKVNDAEQNRTVAIWQGSGAQQIETKMRELGGAGLAISIASNAELPSAVMFKDSLFVAYITSVNQKRSVWLASSSLLSH